MRLSFIFPTWLWLLLLLPPLWALAFAGPPRLTRRRFWASLALRTLALLGLVGSLAGAQLVWPVGAVTTVFVLDASDSVALSQRARAEGFVQQALAGMPADSRAGLVVFGQQALVERTPSGERALGQVAAQPGGGATNIRDALQLGLSLLPDEGYRRIVLLSDGGENRGDALDLGRQAAARGVPIDVVPLSGSADGLDALVSGVELPAAARKGQALRMRINLDSSAPAAARLVVQGPGGARLVDQAVQLSGGPQQLELVVPEAAPSFNRYVVRLEVPGDVRQENNAAEAYSFVSDQPRLLIVAENAADAANLTSALKVGQVQVSVVAPQAVPSTLAALSGYDAVVLANVPRRSLPDRTQALLSAYVHDLGRGLMMLGGSSSFGAGGWRDSPVERALPVQMDIPSDLKIEPVSVVVLIDVSGSMGQEEGGRTKLSLAAEGAQRIASLLRDEDELTVIPFDTEPRNVIGPVAGKDRDRAIEMLRGVQVGGGGINIHDGLAEASKYILQSSRPVRHIITLTDGNDTTQQEGALEIIQNLRSQQVTLSSIAIGDGGDVAFLRDAAKTGTGRFFLTTQASNLPTLLVDETKVVLQPYTVEQVFAPTVSAPHPILRGLSATPQLRGYVVTTPRGAAQVLLTAPRGDPVLAVWQYGLGRSIAWTSDFKGQWGGDWVAWEQFPYFSAQLLGWLLPAQSTPNLTLQSSTSNDVLTLTARAQDDLGKPQAGLQARAVLVASDGVTSTVDLREIGPGQYRAAVRDAKPGAYLVQLSAQDARGQPFGLVTAGAVVPRGAEYLSRAGNLGLLEGLQRLTGGRMDPRPAAAFDTSGSQRGAVREIGQPLLWLALLLLPFDVAVRRLLLGRGQLQALRQAPPPAPVPVPPEPRPAFRLPSISLPKPTGASKTDAELERLREAQEQARRRARGEE
jgi:uncharacterized membrane protein/Mg-chelatase subunit ChlD